jgi:hypothetical protein
MRRSIRAFLVSDAIFIFFGVIAVLIAGIVSVLGHTLLSEALLLGLVAGLLLLLVLRGLIKGKLLVSSVVLSAWLLAYAGLVVLQAPRDLAFVMFLIAFGAIAILYARRAEF